jgi:protein SCO1
VSSAVKKSIITILAFASLSVLAWSQGGNPEGPAAPPANVRPPGLKHVGIEQKLNQQIPLDLVFRDESGKQVKLGDYFGGQKPVILSLVYYHCPMLCSELLAGLEGSLKAIRFNVGQDFDVLTVSFDPKDTPADATEKKSEILKGYRREGAEAGWHFLTGSQESITALTKAVGFDYEFDPVSGQFAHTTAIMLLTPQGKLAQYYYGIEFPPRDLRLGLVQASQNKIGTLADEVLLYCYHYDPKSGKYGAVISHILQLAGGLTIISIGAVVLVLLRRGPDFKSKA